MQNRSCLVLDEYVRRLAVRRWTFRPARGQGAQKSRAKALGPTQSRNGWNEEATLKGECKETKKSPVIVHGESGHVAIVAHARVKQLMPAHYTISCLLTTYGDAAWTTAVPVMPVPNPTIFHVDTTQLACRPGSYHAQYTLCLGFSTSRVLTVARTVRHTRFFVP